ncbi:hypothetical protein CR513_40636, partial [Mucuna pruriens]
MEKMAHPCHGALTNRLLYLNYIEWMQYVKLVINKKGKLGYFTEKLSTPQRMTPLSSNGSKKNPLLLPG